MNIRKGGVITLQLNLFTNKLTQVTPSSYSLEEEKSQENAFLFVLGKNNKDIAITNQGKKDALSIAKQLDLWMQTLSEVTKQDILCFTQLPRMVEEFRFYLLNKYMKQARKYELWYNNLENESYVQDIKRLMLSKIYDFKAQHVRFQSERALHYYQQMEQYKRKYAFAREVTQYIAQQLKEEPVEERLLKQIQDRTLFTLQQYFGLPTESLSYKGDV